MDGLLEVARQPESEILVTAIVGMIGILPTIGDGRTYHYAAGKGKRGFYSSGG